MPDEEAIGLHLPDEAATRRLGADLAMALNVGDCVWLHGDLGAGKSTLARGFVRSMAGDAVDVPSPTFTLVQSYEGRVAVDHADLYRIGDAGEVEELGLDEACENGIVLIEWPDRAADALPPATLNVALSGDDGREATLWGPALPQALRSLQIRAFLGALGKSDATRAHLTGDASSRSYETLPDGSELPRVVMNAPAMPDGAPDYDGLPYSRVAHLAEDVRPFVAVGEALRGAGFAAPRIHAADMEAGLLMIENLGADTIIADGKPLEERYIICAEMLADLHSRPWPDTLSLPDGTDYRVPAYDRGAMQVEVSLIADWYARDVLHREVSDDERTRFRALWDDLLDRLDEEPKTLVLRDFHSPNIVWRDECSGHDRIGIIDFQDAVMGPAAYDLASLAQDARVDIPAAMEARLMNAYAAVRWPEPGDDAVHQRERFETAYAIVAAERASKILGIFVRLDLRDHKPAYRAHLPRMRDYMARSLEHPALRELAAFYRETFAL